jgi:hypothetical protein
VWGAFACVRVLISDASFGFSFLYSHIWLTTVRWCGRREAAGWCGIHYNSSPHSLSLFLLPLYLDSRQIRPSKKSPFAFASLSLCCCSVQVPFVVSFFLRAPFFLLLLLSFNIVELSHHISASSSSSSRCRHTRRNDGGHPPSLPYGIMKSNLFFASPNHQIKRIKWLGEISTGWKKNKNGQFISLYSGAQLMNLSCARSLSHSLLAGAIDSCVYSMDITRIGFGLPTIYLLNTWNFIFFSYRRKSYFLFSVFIHPVSWRNNCGNQRISECV